MSSFLMMNDEKINMDSKEIEKMICFYKAIENGWTAKKENNKYVFTKLGCEKKEMKDFLQNHFNNSIQKK